jgi:hypothetical protein
MPPSAIFRQIHAQRGSTQINDLQRGPTILNALKPSSTRFNTAQLPSTKEQRKSNERSTIAALSSFA